MGEPNNGETQSEIRTWENSRRCLPFLRRHLLRASVIELAVSESRMQGLRKVGRKAMTKLGGTLPRRKYDALEILRGRRLSSSSQNKCDCDSTNASLRDG